MRDLNYMKIMVAIANFWIGVGGLIYDYV